MTNLKKKLNITQEEKKEDKLTDWLTFIDGEDKERIEIAMKRNEIIKKANEEKVEILVFPGSNGVYQLYEDDGISNNFKNGSKVAEANILSCKGEILPSTSVNTVTRGDKGYVNVNGTFNIIYSDGTSKQVEGKVQIRFKDFVNAQ